MTADQTETQGPLTAVYHHAGVTEAKTLADAAPFIGDAPARGRVRYFSSWGKSLEVSDAYTPRAHYLAPLDARFDRAVLMNWAIPLPASRPLAAVIGTMLREMGPGSEVAVYAPVPRDAGQTWIQPEDVECWLPHCPVKRGGLLRRGWYTVSHGAGVEGDLNDLRCTYPILAADLDGFRAVHQRHEPKEPADAAFCYSMHWALHTRAFVDLLTRVEGLDGPLTGLDVGGSHGFLACELALAGHRVTNLELVAHRVEHVQPWLARVCGVEDRVDGVARRMEHMTGGPYDFVSFMGSLLCIDRGDVDGVLANAMGMLKPGGFILTRENTRSPDETDPEGRFPKRFTSQELRSALERASGRNLYVDHLGRTRTPDQMLELKTVFTATRKPETVQAVQGTGPVALVFSTVSPTDEQVRAAAALGRAAGADEGAGHFIATPSSTATPGPGELAGSGGPHVVSPFVPLAPGSLEGAVFAPPLRLFRDAYAEAMIAHYHNAVREGGWVALPFVEGGAAEGEFGPWSLQWLRDRIGRERAVLKKERVAVFDRTDPILPPASVLTAFMDDLEGLSRAFMAERAAATDPAFLETCSSFLPAEGRPVATRASAAATAALPDVAEGIEKFLAYATYSVTGVSYKTEALRRFIASYVPRARGVRTLDIGGGIGLVDLELLLTHPGVEHATIVEPVPATLPVTRRLVERFERQLRGRLRMVIRPAQEHAFDEPVDVVSDFASLLYMPREDLGPTLDRAWASLRPGGILVIHENIKRDIFKARSYYDQVFGVEELETALGRFGEIDRYRSSDMAPISRRDAGDQTIFRVVQKPA